MKMQEGKPDPEPYQMGRNGPPEPAIVVTMILLTIVLATTIFRFMAGRLEREIKQTKPFRSLEEEASLNIQRTAAVLGHAGAELLKDDRLTGAQYNVLRILRGAGAAGLACREIGDRMLNRDPDVTRLLDRLAVAKLVTRQRESADRRVLIAKITREGLGVLAALDGRVGGLHVKNLGHLGRKKLQELIELLESIREKIE